MKTEPKEPIALFAEMNRLCKIEALAKKFTKERDVNYYDHHNADCNIIPFLRYDGAPTDEDCTCGLIELMKALEGK